MKQPLGLSSITNYLKISNKTLKYKSKLINILNSLIYMLQYYKCQIFPLNSKIGTRTHYISHMKRRTGMYRESELKTINATISREYNSSG
jgi:hypothetical protein